MSLVDDLNRISDMQGKPRINPNRIDVFGPQDPPAPPPPNEDPDWLDPELDVDMAPPSPLIPRQAPKPQTPVAETHPNLFSLAVADRMASWKGRDVILSEEDEKNIRSIVLRAIQRALEVEMLDAGIAPRKPRGRKAKASPAQNTTETPEPVPGQPAKRRGRPRGSLLRTQ